jgi:N-acyl-L-homoserine lactone synthetase
MKISHLSVAVFCRTAIALAAFSVPLAPVWAASKQCVTKAEKTALDTRVLQTELMVAALSCGQRDQYNAFVIAFKPELQTNGARLKTLFQRLHGSKSKKELNSFVTRLANDASQQSQLIRFTYCNNTLKLFTETMLAPRNDLSAVTSQQWINDRHGYSQCGGA